MLSKNAKMRGLSFDPPKSNLSFQFYKSQHRDHNGIWTQEGQLAFNWKKMFVLDCVDCGKRMEMGLLRGQTLPSLAQPTFKSHEKKTYNGIWAQNGPLAFNWKKMFV